MLPSAVGHATGYPSVQPQHFAGMPSSMSYVQAAQHQCEDRGSACTCGLVCIKASTQATGPGGRAWGAPGGTRQQPDAWKAS